MSKEVLCSNRGNCICGECQCHSRQNTGEIISGKYCECDTFSCARDINGLSCGGPHKGFCCDGECHCAVFRFHYYFHNIHLFIQWKFDRLDGRALYVNAVLLTRRVVIQTIWTNYVQDMEIVVVVDADVMKAIMENSVRTVL
jgi:hypothetical protein